MPETKEVDFNDYLKETLVRLLEKIHENHWHIRINDTSYHLNRIEREIRQDKKQRKLDALNEQMEEAREQGDKHRELKLLDQWADTLCKEIH